MIWWLVGSSGGFLFSSPCLFILCFAAVVVNIAAVCSLYVYSKHNRACRLLLSLCLWLRRPIITQHQPSSNYYHTHAHAHAHRVYYHLSLCDGTKQQELYTLINQPTCQCIYNNYWHRQNQQLSPPTLPQHTQWTLKKLQITRRPKHNVKQSLKRVQDTQNETFFVMLSLA